jgi:tetratricopeptide (TPR) repeat protein
MFFPRLRKQAKWIFAVLALLFAFSFAFLGVGSGSSGIGDLLRGNFSLFGHGGGGGSGVKKAQKEISANPKQPKGYRDLATAYEGKKQGDQAIAPLETYTQLRPKDQDALRELGGLYLDQAQTALNAAAEAQLSNPVTATGTDFVPTGKLATALGTDPIATAVSTKINATVQENQTKAQSAETNAIGAYKRVTVAAPNDPRSYFDLGDTAQRIGDYKTAISAYTKMIKLEPDSSDVPAIKQRIKQLQKALGPTPTSG